MPFVWEEILNAITELPPDMCIEVDELLGRWIIGITHRMYEEGISIKKCLDLDMQYAEELRIFENSGYIMCEDCRKIVEDDHECPTQK
jgi:hypothetical protein